MGSWQGHEVPLFVLNKILNIWIYGPFRHQKNKKSNKQTDKNCQIAVSTTVISNISSTMVTKYLQFRTSLYTDVVLCFFLVVVSLARQ